MTIGVLEPGAIEGNVVGDAVHDHRIGGRLVEAHGADFDKLRLNAVQVPGIDLLHQRAGKAVFHAEEDADPFHCCVALQ